MTFDVTGVLRDAWAMAKRDARILTAVAGLMMFVPQYAMLLFMQPPPIFPGFGSDPAAAQVYTAASQAWLTSYGFGALVAVVLPVVAQVTIMALYVDPARPTVAEALALAPVRFFPALLVVIVASPMGVVLQVAPLLILLAAYLEGRLLLALPILFGERPVSAFGAIGASWRRTRGHGLLAAGLACITVIGGVILATPFVMIGKSLNGAPLANPVVAALLDGGTALAVTLGAVATILVQVALYRRLSSGT